MNVRTNIGGWDEEICRVVRILSWRTNNNPVLIGEPGMAKTAVLEGLAQRGDVPSNLVEVRHGVRIQDRALVTAAQLSLRYIMDKCSVLLICEGNFQTL